MKRGKYVPSTKFSFLDIARFLDSLAFGKASGSGNLAKPDSEGDISLATGLSH